MRFFSKPLQWILYSILRLSNWKREVFEQNLSFVKPSMEKKQRKILYGRLLKNISTDAAEFLTRSCIYSQGNFHFQISEESKPVIERMKKGGLMLTAHLLKYESIGPWLVRLGIPLTASYAKIKPKFLDKWVHSSLRSVDGKTYSLFIHNPRKILNLLNCGKLFCLIADQDYRKKNSTPGTLFEKHVHCNPIPSFILRNLPKTPIYICWIRFQNSIHILHAMEIFPKDSEDIFKIYNQWLETEVNLSKENWYGWIHRRYLSTIHSTFHKEYFFFSIYYF